MAREWRQIPGNEHAYDRLREVVASGEAIGFVGAGASAELYPVWTALIRRLADEAVNQGLATDAEQAFWLAATTRPQQAVRGIKQALGDGAYAEALRRIFAPRPGLDGNYFTPLHGRLVRLAFRGFVTTNYDLGLVQARNMLRQDPRSSFATGKDQDEIHRWLTDTIFRERPCPILFAHGVYDRSDTIVLGADEYREAYKNGPYARLFDKLWGQSRLVFAGFGFSDPWLDFLAELVITQAAARKSAAPQHLAIIGLKEEDAYTRERRRNFRDAYNADPLFYPISVAPKGAEDHAALLGILDALAGEEGTTVRAVEAEARHPPSRTEAIKDLAAFRDVDVPWCSEMVALPVGEFLMGSPEDEEDRFDDEGPQHRVTIDRRFAIGRYTVTFDEYDYFCAATERKKPEDNGWGRRRRPMIAVSWRDAVAYCAWLANKTGQPYRLPSEAEWEYAARAGTTTRYAFGDAITPKDANYSESKLGKTTEVGAYSPNAWGLDDMHGNVWEWVEDVWHNSYKGAPNDGSAWTDGEGENSSRNRVLRGGSWFNGPRYLRSADRDKNVPGGRDCNLGFRIARTLD